MLLAIGTLTVPAPGSAGAVVRAQAAQSQAVTLEDHLKRAEVFIKVGKTADAKQEITRALKIDKNNAAANYLMALACSKRGESKDAMSYLDRALKKQRDFADAHYLRAVLLHNEAKNQEALKEAQQALNLGLEQPNLIELKSDLEMILGAYKDGAETYRRLLGLLGDAATSEQRENLAALQAYLQVKDHKDENNKMPVVTSSVYPRYTTQASYNHINGTVTIFVLIDEQGSVASARVLSRLGYGLDEEALIAAKQVKFSPAVINGRPAPVWVPMHLDFSTIRQ